MRQFFIFSFVALTLIATSSCRKVTGSGPIVTETRHTGHFNEISLDVPGELRYIASDQHEVTIEAQRNIIDVIQTNISDGELRIRVKHNTRIGSHENIRITVKAPAVEEFAVNGTGEIYAENLYTNDDASLSVSGSGKIVLDHLEARELETRISGSGSIRVSGGAVSRHEIALSGSGDVDAAGVTATTASTHISGSGTIRIAVTNKLEVNISGSGEVFYKGNPSVSTQISGSGKAIPMD